MTLVQLQQNRRPIVVQVPKGNFDRIAKKLHSKGFESDEGCREAKAGGFHYSSSFYKDFKTYEVRLRAEAHSPVQEIDSDVVLNVTSAALVQANRSVKLIVDAFESKCHGVPERHDWEYSATLAFDSEVDRFIGSVSGLAAAVIRACHKPGNDVAMHVQEIIEKMQRALTTIGSENPLKPEVTTTVENYLVQFQQVYIRQLDKLRSDAKLLEAMRIVSDK